jgi:hypothetical protein
VEVGEVGQGDAEADSDRSETAMDFITVVFRTDEQYAAGLWVVPEPRAIAGYRGG